MSKKTVKCRYYIEKCDTGEFLSHRDTWVEEFPDAQTFDSYVLAARVMRDSKLISIDPSDTVIRSEEVE